MTDKIAAAFGTVRTEDALKARTAAFLARAREGGARPRRTALRAAPVLCALMLMAGFWLFGLLRTPVAYLDMDVNPSVGLALNRFDRVVSLSAYNAEAERLTAAMELENKPYAEAIDTLLAAMHREGYLAAGDPVSVSVSLRADDPDRESALLRDTRAYVARSLGENAPPPEVFTVDAELLGDAHACGVSPARYIAITELMEVDPTAGFAGCMGYSLSELRQRTQHCRAAAAPQGGGVWHRGCGRMR